MQGKITHFLNLPLPRLVTLPYGWVYLLFIFIYIPVALRLRLFFVDHRWDMPDNKWLPVVFGALCILIYILFYFILPFFFRNYYHKHRWTLRKELRNMICFFVTVLLLNTVFLRQIMPGQPDCSIFALYVWHISFSYNLIPVLCATAIKSNYYFARKRWLTKEDKPGDLPELDENEKALDLRPYKGQLYRHNDLAFFHVNGNYTEIYTYENNELRKTMLQVSLITIEHLLPVEAQFIRCHNAYLVNVDKIESCSGSKRQRKLKVAGCKTNIDVSYSQADKVSTLLKKNKNNMPA